MERASYRSIAQCPSGYLYRTADSLNLKIVHMVTKWGQEELLNNSLGTLAPHHTKLCQFPSLLPRLLCQPCQPCIYSLLAFLQDNRLKSPLSPPQVIHGVLQLHAAIVTIPT